MAEATLITARALLLRFLELRNLSPDLSDWTEKRLSDNPPRIFRLRQLAAMFNAFDLPWNPQLFIEGGFISPEQKRYADALSKLAEEMPEMSRKLAESDQLPDFFRILFDYRSRVDDVLYFPGGVLEASGLYLHAYSKAGELNKIIHDNVNIIDDALVALISPEAATFTVENLVQDYGYPDVDLSEIDADWW